MNIFWYVAPCILVEICRRFRCAISITRAIFPDDGRSYNLRNVGALLSDYMMQHTRRQLFHTEILWLTGYTEQLGEKLSIVPLPPPWTSLEVTMDWTRVSVIRSQRLAALAMARAVEVRETHHKQMKRYWACSERLCVSIDLYMHGWYWGNII
jgi:hypothetical protein